MQLNVSQLQAALPWSEVIEALRVIFTREVNAPIRHHHTMQVSGDPDATLLLMPAWLENEFVGVKLVNVFPGNNDRQLPGLSSHYMLSCGKTGQPLLQIDGNELTARRTAAASALASSYLSRPDSQQMLMVGAGRMARRLIPAHRSVRPLSKVFVWDRNQIASDALVAELCEQDIDAQVCSDEQLPAVAKASDLISCATMAKSPVIKGEWLSEGTHLDLVGSFVPDMRETDNDAMQKGCIFVDTRAGTLVETGDIILPIAQGAITKDDIIAEFSELCAGQHPGRKGLASPDSAITVFKSVGDSREDLAAAVLAYQKTSQGS